MGPRVETRHSQNFTEKPHFWEKSPGVAGNPSKSSSAVWGTPAWTCPYSQRPAHPWASGTMTSQYDVTKRGLTDVLGTLRSAMEWINQERAGGSDEWGGCWDQSCFKLGSRD